MLLILAILLFGVILFGLSTLTQKRILKILLIIISGIVVLFGVFVLIMDISENHYDKEKERRRVDLEIYSSEDSKDPLMMASFALTTDKTILGTLEDGYELLEQRGGMSKVDSLIVEWEGDNAIIVSMLEIENEGDNKWICFVNGKRSDLPINQAPVEYGDTVECRYMTSD